MSWQVSTVFLWSVVVAIDLLAPLVRRGCTWSSDIVSLGVLHSDLVL